MNNHFILVLFLGFASLFSGNAFGIILYVPGQYPTIQAGINTASYGDTVQVAAGTYYEHITMKSGVIVQGAGAGDNPSIHSIIDGGGTSTVVTASDVDSAAKIDGFKVTNGFGDVGGGMYNKNSSPTVANCTFSRNSSGWVGGGMNNDNSFPTVTDCTFSENTALLTGGGMNNDTSSPTVTNCIFYKNTATSGSGMNNNNSSPIITKCTFSENSAEGLIGGFGGGMNNVGGSPTVTDCNFSENYAWLRGGGMWNGASSPIVTNCIFTENSAGLDGGGMWNDSSSSTVTGCTFSGNVAGEDSWASGGGMGNYYCSSSLTITNCIFSGNSAGKNGGGMFNTYSSPTVTNCTFSVNTVGYIDEMDYYWGWGGGMSNNASSPTVTNCIFYGNRAIYGAGGMYNFQSSPTVTNCTFFGDSAGPVPEEKRSEEDDSWGAGGIYNRLSSQTTVTNCIMWGDWPFEIVNQEAPSTSLITYSDIQGGYMGTGNIAKDPMFESPATGDFHIIRGSPCIDKGTSNGAPNTDFEGDPRPQGTGYDIGADEYIGATAYKKAIPWVLLLLLDD